MKANKLFSGMVVDISECHRVFSSIMNVYERSIQICEPLIDVVYAISSKKYFSDNQKKKRIRSEQKKLALKDLINEEKAHSLSLPLKMMFNDF